MTKLHYGRSIAAALAYLMLHQNDAVGLALFDREIRYYLPPRAAPSHFHLIAGQLEAAEPGSDTQLGPVLHELAGKVRRRGLIILISDLLDRTEAIQSGLSHFRHRQHDIIVLHLADPDEVSFPFERLTRFKDMEGAGSLVTNPASVRHGYLRRMNAFLADVKTLCLERNINYDLLQTDEPWDQALSSYLAHRSRITKRRR
jgi:uncharacterized protein (DUF58 family)